MGVLDRMGRAISERFDALLDGVDDPARSIEQTLREMEGQLRAGQREVVRGVAAQKQLERKAASLTEQAQRWQQRAELALTHSDDGLAREALRQKRRVEQERAQVETLRQQQRAYALESKHELERMEAKIEEVRARKGQLAVQLRQARSGGGVDALGAKPGAPTPLSEFRRLEDQIDGVQAAIEAQQEVEEALGGGRGPGGMSRDEVEAKFRALEYGEASDLGAPAGTDDIDSELEALRQRVRIKT